MAAWQGEGSAARRSGVWLHLGLCIVGEGWQRKLLCRGWLLLLGQGQRQWQRQGLLLLLLLLLPQPVARVRQLGGP